MTDRVRARLGRGAAVIVLFALLVAARLDTRFALLPNPLALELLLDDAAPPRSEPLITAGETGRGDFLAVRFVDRRTVVFAYDSWGHPVAVSAPVPIEPGRRLRLDIEMPALDQVRHESVGPPSRVRVTVEGRTVLDVAAHHYVRDPEKIYFAENPIGGTACSARLRGKLLATDGRELRGTPDAGFHRHSRWALWSGLLGRWFRHEPGQVATLLLASLGLVWGGSRLAAAGLTGRAAAGWMVRHRWFIGTATIVTLGFTWLVTLGTFRFNEREIFGSFYDHQAASLLAGRLDVPEEAIGGEAFVVDGKLYGYFGPTPALLRLPFVLSGIGFGRLSRAFMVAYFAACLVAAYLALREAIRLRDGLASGAADVDVVPAPFSTVVLLAGAGWGSTLFFLGSRGLIFHEAILGGAALALWSGWCSLRWLRAPATRGWAGALALGILSTHTRPTTGLFALTLLGVVALAHAGRDYREHARRKGRGRLLLWGLARYAAVGLGCVAGALSLHGFAYLKFGVFDPAPLRISRPYADPARLAAIDGKSMHAVNLPFNFYTYVVRPNLRLERGFPWIYLGSPNPGLPFPRAKIDLPDHTAAMPGAMPGLFALATLGGLGALLACPGLRPAVLLLWLATIPMTLVLFAAVATAQRYTGDFCPALILAAATALAALESERVGLRRALQVAVATATLAAIAVTGAITLHYQGDYLWGVPDETRQGYQRLRRAVDSSLGISPR